MEHHQRSPEGNLLITSAMAREMPIPKDFDAFCWMSQINQAMAMRTAVEHWRRLKPWCMGALYWQLANLWPVASWSSIDYHGRWKVLQHAASRFFAPLLASIVVSDDHVEVWATSDLAEPLALRGELDVVSWSGRRVARVRLRARLRAGESRRLVKVPITQLLRSRAERHEVCCFVRLTSGRRSAENFAALVPWKWAPLAEPRVDVEPYVRLAPASNSPCERASSRRSSTPSSPTSKATSAATGTCCARAAPTACPGSRTPNRGAGATRLAAARAKLRTLSLWDLNEH